MFKKKARKQPKEEKKTATKEKTSTKKKQKEVHIDDARFTENLVLATKVIAQGGENEGTLQQAETSQPLTTGIAQHVPREPQVVINPGGRGIWMCKGCMATITSEEQSYPNNMVFHRIRIWGKFLLLQNKWIQNKYNMHFHLNFNCLHENDSTVELWDTMMNAEFFQDLTREQMEIL